jgi:hypothetical protein
MRKKSHSNTTELCNLPKFCLYWPGLPYSWHKPIKFRTKTDLLANLYGYCVDVRCAEKFHPAKASRTQTCKISIEQMLKSLPESSRETTHPKLRSHSSKQCYNMSTWNGALLRFNLASESWLIAFALVFLDILTRVFQHRIRQINNW